MVASPIADPGLISLISARLHKFMEMYHEIFSTFIPLLPLIQGDCCQLQAKVCAPSNVQQLTLSLSRKSVDRLTDHLNMTIAVDCPSQQLWSCSDGQLNQPNTQTIDTATEVINSMTEPPAT